MKRNIIYLAILLFSACNCIEKKDMFLSKEEMLKIVKENDLKFSAGVKNKDSALLVGIYSDSAQYVQPQRKIITGKFEIGKEWAGF